MVKKDTKQEQRRGLPRSSSNPGIPRQGDSEVGSLILCLAGASKKLSRKGGQPSGDIEGTARVIWGVSGGVGMRGCLEEGTCPYWETGLDVKIGHSIATVDGWCSQQGTPPGGLVRVRNVGTGRAGTFPLVLRRRSGARIGYRRDGPMGGCWPFGRHKLHRRRAWKMGPGQCSG